ncbi:MAG: glycoside hydrolase family 99-like domain-containing protein [Microcoleus sp. PH2017_29_MFU_D_A]|uniref:glycoside hydrolase family 99-like domain-containing protein n=1 Tax=unclassified Microcoleus TaxID=2642155 RepID=UPI001D6FB386|nr:MULTISPECIES: glycoside hydrolase family 99-like domain-containing protein [unclassified Microcoleus]MCC3604621.1 glycoside hydrolase family 99-like domain-containing protein [Microcoleus sp. PH2017_29_MFU_D_A]MCC3635476.1 glycoside hydrolase family 99-like domain-containing protein [Microcoleus sp. PH2017_37_MFU_D_B]
MPSTVNTESTAVQFNQQGEIYLSQRKLAEAIASCEQALKIDPNFAPAYKTLGNALQAQGRMEEARHWYAKAIEIAPNFAEVYANLGSIGAQQEKWSEAIEFYQKAIALKPNFAGVYRNLAKVFGQIGKAAEAQECWYRAFCLEPEKASPAEHLSMGDAFFRQEKFPEAIGCYDRAIKLNPNLPQAYQNLGEALKKEGKLQEATVYYRKAIELNAANARNGSEGEQTLAGATATNGAAVKPQPAATPAKPVVKPPVQQPVNSIINIEDPEAYKILAEGYFAQGKLEQAISACKKALQIKPEAPLYKMLGNALQAGGKIDEAKSCYVKAIEINPNFAEAYANYGSICAQQEQWQQAVSAYEKAIAIKPDFAGALRNFGKLLAQLGKSEAAAEAWYRAFAIDPKSGTAEEHENLAKTLIEQGKVEQGIDCYRRAVELNPNAGAAYHELGELLKNQEQWEAAVDAYTNAIKTNPELSWSHNNLAESLVKLERWEEAINAYRKAIELNPDFSWSHNNLADVLLKLERWEEAVEAYQKATELNPDFSWSHNYLADALIKLGRWEEAISAYQRSIELNPDHFWAHNNLAEALVNLERWDEAVVAYRRANELNPSFFWSHSKLGDALLEMERWDEAIAVYRRAAELNRDFPWTYYNMGTAFEKLERWDESIVAYRCAVEIQPDLPWISQKLADALRMRSQWDLQDAMRLYQRAIQENADDLQLYHKALEIAPNDADLYVGLADALVRHSWPDGAIVFYQMALQVRPDDNAISGLLNKVLEKKKPIKNQSRVEILSRVKSPEPLPSSRIEHQSPVEVLSPIKSSEPFLTGGIVVSEPGRVQPTETDVRLIAFYLPQFHPIPENDLWWGKGFTEWTNVTKANPLFEGHYQPHLPADLGFYDLRLPEVREAQAALAKQYGIHGFCYYYYWFAGKRLLNRPLDEVLQMKKPDFPFCICWANENWTRRWDGAEHEILMTQECWSDEQNQAFAESIVHILLDERYIRINGAPLLIVYRHDLFPDLRQTAEQWRKIFRKNGVGEVHLCIAITFSGLQTSLEQIGFDSAVQFPPHGFSAREISSDELTVDDFSGHLYDYKDGVINSLSQEFPELKVFRSVMTSWDNTARRKRAAHAFINSHPDVYELWLRGIIEKTRQVNLGDEKLVFINAWNEWAEGAHLEPDQKYGYSYLLATRRALNGTHSWKTIIDVLRYVPIKSVDHLHSQLNDLENRINGINRSIEEMNKLLEKTAKIIDISRSQNSELLLWQLDCPQADTRVSVNSIEIKGWAVSQKSLPVEIKVLSNTQVIQQTAININRPDVAEVHLFPGSENSGFSMIVQVAGMPSEAFLFLHLEALLEDGSCIPIEVIRLRQGYDPLQDLAISVEQKEMLSNAHADVAKRILNMIRALPIESVNHRYQLLDELQNKIEVKELLLEAMNQVLKPISVHDFYQQV